MVTSGAEEHQKELKVRIMFLNRGLGTRLFTVSLLFILHTSYKYYFYVLSFKRKFFFK